MTTKQTLWAHVRAHHSARRQPSPRLTLVQLQRWHAKEHHRLSPNHNHGMTTGPNDRPAGWFTGENTIPNKAAKA